eukprot:gene32370-41943_t
MASVQDMTDDNFTAEMRKLRAGAIMGGPSNRIAVAFRLASREPVPENTWIVDHDEAGFPGHVTIAVCNGNGLPAVEEDIRKFHIPELSNMNWELTSSMYVCQGRADWRDDYLPGSDGWRDVIKTFELIMRLMSFLTFGVSTTCCIMEIKLLCRKFNIVPVFGSSTCVALSYESSISFPGARAVTVTHGMETLCFTWYGDTFKDCSLDEIIEEEVVIEEVVGGEEGEEEVEENDDEEGVISLMLSNHRVVSVVVRAVTAAEKLFFKTVVEQQILSIAAENYCQGITTLSGETCCNKTLMAYQQADIDEWRPLCWSHKQQILQ